MTRDGDTRDQRTENQSSRAGEVFDAAWEKEARATLELAGFDGDLAVDAARDALRVLTGELDEEEFRRRYHRRYVREFGVDDRPAPGHPAAPAAGTQPSEASEAAEGAAIGAGDGNGEADEPPLTRSGDTLLSRRSALGLAGAGAAALFLGDLAYGSGGTGSPGAAVDDESASTGGQAEAADEDRSVRWGMVVDLERCDGCLMCVMGCQQQNGLPEGVHWIYSLAYREPDRPDDLNILLRMCQHCSNAPCVKVCPTAARHYRDDGLVLVDYDLCIGCRYCQVACPYGANYFQWTEPENYGGGFDGERKDARGRSVVGDPPVGVMGKCTFCPTRQDAALQSGENPPPGETTCELACPHDVLHFGDLNDPDSKPNRYLEEKRREKGGPVHTFRLLEDLGTRPNVIYIGSPPSPRAEAVEPPFPYEERGFVEERRIVLEGPEPWFRRIRGESREGSE